MKLTLENVKKIKNETNNRLVSRVCRYIISNWEYWDSKENIFLSVMHNGCKSDACRDLICYGQTKNFYETYKHEINELLFKNGYDNFALDEDNLAWFGFEKTLTQIAYKFGIE